MFIGIDIVEISRIEQAITEQGDKFLDRVYTKQEIERFGDSVQSLAARFAAKEAVIKALNSAGEGVSYRDIEVLAESSGKPTITLYRKALKLAAGLGIVTFSLSLSHSADSAIAVVTGEL